MVVVKRMRHNLGISFSTTIGVVSVLSIVIGVPIFSYSISSEILVEQLKEKSNISNRGLFSLHMYYIDDPKASEMTFETVKSIENYLKQATSRLLNLKTEQVLTETQTRVISWYPDQVRPSLSEDQPWVTMRLTAHAGLQEKAEIVEGAWPDAISDPNQPIQVAVLESAADTFFLNVGDRFYNGPLNIEVAGIWRPTTLDPASWYDSPRLAYANTFWVPESVFEDVLPKYLDRPHYHTYWYVTINDSDLRFDQAIKYAQGMIRMSGELTSMVPGIIVDYSPLEALEIYLERSLTLTNLFYAVN